MRRFVEHQRARLRRAASSRRARRAAPRAGRNPSKQKRSVGSAAIDSAATAAHGPGTATTSMPAAAAARTSSNPGIADRRRAGIAHQRDRLRPRACSRTNSGERCASLCSCSDTSGGRMPKWRSSAPRMARVLRRDQRAAAQRLARARAQVAQIADRRRHHVEPPRGRVCHYNPRLAIAGFQGMQGMAAISSTSTADALARSSLLLLAIVGLQPGAAGADAGATSRSARSVWRASGRHADAARAYARAGRRCRRPTTTITSCRAPTNGSRPAIWRRRKRRWRAVSPECAHQAADAARAGRRRDRAGRK